jgi:hypothetical protein
VVVCCSRSNAQEGLPEKVLEVVNERIEEVRGARELSALDARDPDDHETIRSASRNGTPYERFVAARELSYGEGSAKDLDDLAKHFRDSSPRFADYCTALEIVTSASRASADGECPDDVYVAKMRGSNRPFLTDMLATLYLERAAGRPAAEVWRAAGLPGPQDSSPIVQYHWLKRDAERETYLSTLIRTLEASVLPERGKDPSFPARVQAATAALIDVGPPAVAALLERYGDKTQPSSSREYLTLLYVVDVLQGTGAESGLAFLESLERIKPLEGAQRKEVAMHRAGVFELPRAAAVAQVWIRSGERYPYHDWLAGWYRWFVTHQ